MPSPPPPGTRGWCRCCERPLFRMSVVINFQLPPLNLKEPKVFVPSLFSHRLEWHYDWIHSRPVAALRETYNKSENIFFEIYDCG